MIPSDFSVSLKHTFLPYLCFFGVLFLLSCQKESRGFVLPDGDTAVGKQLFSNLYCTDCHSINNMTWTGAAYGDYPNVKLGGDVTRLKSYGELVTSVINPSHKLSQRNIADQQLATPDGASKMEARCYNDIVSVQQLIDIVAFLQSEYKLVVPTNTYPYE